MPHFKCPKCKGITTNYDSCLNVECEDYREIIKKDDGGPAFPCTEPCSYEDGPGGDRYNIAPIHLGMSRRDWLAGLAMQGMISNPEIDTILKEIYKEGDDVKAILSGHSYKIADAMIKEGNK